MNLDELTDRAQAARMRDIVPTDRASADEHEDSSDMRAARA